MSGALAPTVRPTRALGLYAFVFGVAGLAVLAALAVLVLALQGRTETLAVAAPARQDVPSQVGRPFLTSFGVVSVDQFVKLREPNGRAIIRRSGREAIQVAVTLTNLKSSRLPLSARMFAVRVDATGARVAPTIWSLPAGVKGQSARKALFRYIVPDEGSPLTLVFGDPRRPLLIGLGRVDGAPVIPLNLDLHGNHGKH